MPHANTRLTLHGRSLLIERVVVDGRPVSHVAKELGISRQCAHRWINRHRAEGTTGLHNRSSRPRTSPRKTSSRHEAAVVVARMLNRDGPLRIAAITKVPPRTVSRILARYGLPPLSWLDPITGETIRSSRATAERYERDRPGELVHIDVKKLGRIPEGGGWRALGREAT
ncbi:helix-turn-helix domain-containing protein, partial [Cryobacterium sp. 1639]|uniref:helix-turn-helix domain-containing protein n=1 Tax=Cryobacterium inferilacus TaxID=2866629 RepID=UPI001C735640